MAPRNGYTTFIFSILFIVVIGSGIRDLGSEIQEKNQDLGLTSRIRNSGFTVYRYPGKECNLCYSKKLY